MWAPQLRSIHWVRDCYDRHAMWWLCSSWPVIDLIHKFSLYHHDWLPLLTLSLEATLPPYFPSQESSFALHRYHLSTSRFSRWCTKDRRIHGVGHEWLNSSMCIHSWFQENWIDDGDRIERLLIETLLFCCCHKEWMVSKKGEKKGGGGKEEDKEEESTRACPTFLLPSS